MVSDFCLLSLDVYPPAMVGRSLEWVALIAPGYFVVHIESRLTKITQVSRRLQTMDDRI